MHWRVSFWPSAMRPLFAHLTKGAVKSPQKTHFWPVEFGVPLRRARGSRKETQDGIRNKQCLVVPSTPPKKTEQCCCKSPVSHRNNITDISGSTSQTRQRPLMPLVSLIQFCTQQQEKNKGNTFRAPARRFYKGTGVNTSRAQQRLGRTK
jgi:hypothetical protein